MQTAPALLGLPGCGALTAAKVLAEIGPIDRFERDAQLARHGGVAPRTPPTSELQQFRHYGRFFRFGRCSSSRPPGGFVSVPGASRPPSFFACSRM